MAVAATGGTFDTIHRGHRTLLLAALSYDHTIIGLSTDGFAARRGKAPAHSYAERRDGLVSYIEGRRAACSYEVCPLDDTFGPAVMRESVDILVVSEETRGAGHTLNAMRAQRGLDPVRVVVVPMVCGNGGAPISTTDIRDGLMDTEGNATL